MYRGQGVEPNFKTISGDFCLCVQLSVFIITYTVMTSDICGSSFLYVFYIFAPSCVFIVWFVIALYITPNIFSSLIFGISFKFMVSFSISRQNILGVVLKYFVMSKEFSSFFKISDVLSHLLDFLLQLFFYYQDFIIWCYLIFSFNFSCFSSFHLDTLTHIVESSNFYFLPNFQ